MRETTLDALGQLAIGQRIVAPGPLARRVTARRITARRISARRTIALGILASCVAAGCAPTTTLEFRSPAGSYLELERSWTNPPRRVEFVSRAEFHQVDSPRDATGAELRGEIRVDGEVALDRLPPGAERYLERDGDRVTIGVRGYYWVYRFEQTTTDELTVHYVDVTPTDIYLLLEGRAVTVEERSAAGEPVFRFQFGIELPEPQAASTGDAGTGTRGDTESDAGDGSAHGDPDPRGRR